MEFPALYIRDADQIASGRKTALASPTGRYTPGTYLLLVKDPTTGAYTIPGSVTLDPPQTLSPAQFEAAAAAHLVSRKQRLQWWPLAEQLYVYPLHYTPQRPLTVHLAPGSTGEVRLKGLGLTPLAQVEGHYLYALED